MEAKIGHTYTLTLSEEEVAALEMSGVNIQRELDSISNKAQRLIHDMCEGYILKCFHEQIPLDCFCQKELFRRYCKKRADVAPAI